MWQEDKLLFACTRQNSSQTYIVTIRDLCAVNPICWRTVYQTAEQHGMAPLIYANLQQCDVQGLRVPQRVTEQSEHVIYRNIALQSGVSLNSQRCSRSPPTSCCSRGPRSIL